VKRYSPLHGTQEGKGVERGNNELDCNDLGCRSLSEAHGRDVHLSKKEEMEEVETVMMVDPYVMRPVSEEVAQMGVARLNC